MWIQALGDHDLLGLPLEYISKYRFVCSCHFNDIDYIARSKNIKRIKVHAVPVKFLTNVPLTDNEIM